MCSDLDSCLVAVADAHWNTAKGCEMSYIIPHSEIMLKISDTEYHVPKQNNALLKIIRVCIFCKSGLSLFCMTAKTQFHPLENVTVK